jgi:long-chain acyl-CoA synthetase
MFAEPSASLAAMLTDVRRAATRLQEHGTGAGDRVLLISGDPRLAAELYLATITIDAQLQVTGTCPPAGEEGAPRVVCTDQAEIAARYQSSGLSVLFVGGGFAGGAGRRSQPEGGRLPSGPSASACLGSASLFVDMLGIARGGTTLLALPLSEPRTCWLAAGLLASGRAVSIPDLTFSDIGGALDERPIDDLVSSPLAITYLIDAATLHRDRRPRQVIALGADETGQLRKRVQETLGDDALVEYEQDAGRRHLVPSSHPTSGAGFWTWSERRPDAIAVVTETQEIVRAGQLRQRAERLAAAMSQAGDEAIACLFDRPLEVLVAYLAACRAGKSLLPLDPSAASAYHDHLITTSGASIVLVAEAGDIDWPNAVSSHVTTLTTDQFIERFRADPLSGTPAAGGLLPYTSGTSGLPKLVHHVHHSNSSAVVGAYERVFGGLFGFRDGGIHLVTLPLHQFAALNFASMALHAGERLVLMGTWSARRGLDAMVDERITSSFMVPSMFEGLLSLPAADRARAQLHLEAVVHSTASCPVTTKHAMMRWWGPVLHEFFGSTEMRGCIVGPKDWLARPGTVGRPFPGSDVVVLGPDGEPAPPGVMGRIYLSDSGFTYSGGRPSDELAPAGFASVGDIGYVDEDGWLYVTGRESDHISVGGKKFHPSVVEIAIGGIDGVDELVVFGMPQAQLGHVVAAAVAVDPASDANRSTIRGEILRRARRTLEIHQVPVKVVFLERIPKDGYGKVRRAELVERVLEVAS